MLCTFQEYPGLCRRLACMLYESLLLFAVAFIPLFLFSALTRYQGTGPLRLVFQLYLFSVMAIYFTWFWSRGRRTLAMKTWRLRITEKDGKPLMPKRAFLRYCLAWLCLTGISILWALFDRERLFLHDRLAGTRLVISRD
jgi:uncharacterized RDD family membrane protein YckC